MAIRLKANFERCCRLCAEEQDVTIMIFSDEAEAMLLQNKLNRYLLIEVDEDDKLPKYICINCCTKLHTVCEFIDTARKAQEVLFKRSLELDQIQSGNYMTSSIEQEIKTEAESYPDNDEKKYTEMEISVDPMMVLQNSQETLSSDTSDDYIEDVTYLHGVDSENVTIKLIRRGDKTDSTVKKNKIGTKLFPCVTCKRGFHSESALQNHSWVHSKEDKTEKQFKCSTCNEIFISKSALIQHLNEHKDKGLCQLCGRTFRSEKTYTAHMTGHLKKSYNCKICGRSYSTWGNLKAHSVAHSNDRPFVCPYPYCKKTFKRNQDLKFHVNQHTGVKPYQCPFCEKSFASSGNCYSHRNRKHPGQDPESIIHRWGNVPRDIRKQPRPIAPKPTIVSVKGIFKYQCQLCEHSFLKQENYTYHMYKHTGEKPFNCSFCTEKFVTRKGLLLHHDKYHPTLDRPLALLTKNVLLK